MYGVQREIPMSTAIIELDTPIDEVLNRYPELASIFVRHHMICVGCAIARFHSIQDAALTYQTDPDLFLREMQLRVSEALKGQSN